MGLFTPHKKHANAFNYIPRYYDPEKERREQRRRELRGESSADEGTEYTPGQYIRTQREARKARREAERAANGGITRKIAPVAGILLMLVIIYLIFPRVVAMFSQMRVPQKTQEQIDIEEFNPYTPITIVPNDYKEEE